MRRALDHAEQQVSTWGELALAYLELYAETHDAFPGWFVTRAAELDRVVPTPPTLKAWGAIFKKAARLGYIKRTGYTPDPHRHAAPAPLWTSLIYHA
jgi:hypothetical protein